MNGDGYIRNIVKLYRTYKQLGDKAIAQVHADGDLNVQLDPVDNSIAVIVKHVAGNLRSRFTEFLTTDGEKPNRDRDSEFETATPPTRAQVQQWWDGGFAVAIGTIESLRDEDLDRTVYIRGEAHTVVEALNRSVAHTAYHAGQIVYLARHFTGEGWTSLTIPKRKK